jgi:hypothetical protein
MQFVKVHDKNSASVISFKILFIVCEFRPKIRMTIS